MLKLSETIREVLKRMTQKSLGIALGMPPDSAQQNVSNMKRAAPDSDLELHWQQSLKLLKICKEIGIDPAQSSQSPAARQATGGGNAVKQGIPKGIFGDLEKAIDERERRISRNPSSAVPTRGTKKRQ